MNELTKQTVVFQNKEYTLVQLSSSKGVFGIAPYSLEMAIFNIIGDDDNDNDKQNKDYDEACRIDTLYDYVVGDDIIEDTDKLAIMFCDLLDKE